MSDPFFYEDMRRKHQTGSGVSTASAPYSETITVPAGRLTIEFTPNRPADVDGARREMQKSITASFKTIPACQLYLESTLSYQNVQKDKVKAETELAAAREKLAASLNDQDAYRDAFINIGRLGSLLSMRTEQLAALAGVVAETKGPATKAIKKVAERAIQPQAVSNRDAFAALVCTLRGAADSLRTEPSAPFLRDLDPENDAARAVAELLPADLRPGYAPPPPEMPAREVAPIPAFALAGYSKSVAPNCVIPVAPANETESTITHH
jgi:hypothetical protein